MRAVTVLYRLGGVASRATLVQATSRRAFNQAVRRGAIVRDAYGRYALPTADEALRAANALSGVVSFRSSAAFWGWEQKLPPAKPEVTVRRKRSVAQELQRAVRVHWADLAPHEIHEGLVTTRERTLVDCLRGLPFDEALAIADSALRHGDITKHGLVALADTVTGPGSAKARSVAAHADGRAANPFESVLRAVALPLRGLHFMPQVAIRLPQGTIYPDLVDEQRRIVAEADSFEWHGGRAALRRDCRRYNRLTVRGWIVLRFAWEDVMFDPSYVRSCLELAVQLAAQRAQRPRRVKKAA